MKRKIKIEGMSCNHCKAHVEEALQKLNGIECVEVSLEDQSAMIIGDADEETIKNAIDDAGYDVTGICKL